MAVDCKESHSGVLCVPHECYNQLQKYLRHCTIFWLKWPVYDLVLVTPPCRSSYNPRQNYLRKFSPSCPLSYTTKLFPKRCLCGKKTPSPNSMLLSGEGGEGRTGTATMFRKMLSKYTIFSTVLSKIVAIQDHA